MLHRFAQRIFLSAHHPWAQNNAVAAEKPAFTAVALSKTLPAYSGIMFGRKKAAEKAGPPFSQLSDNGISLAEPAFPSSSFPPSAFNGPGMDALPSLRDTVKKRLLNDMIRGFAGEPAGVVMLVDSFTLRVLSSVCKMSELLDENIHLVENITMQQNGEYLKRQPLPVRGPYARARAAAARSL